MTKTKRTKSSIPTALFLLLAALAGASLTSTVLVSGTASLLGICALSVYAWCRPRRFALLVVGLVGGAVHMLTLHVVTFEEPLTMDLGEPSTPATSVPVAEPAEWRFLASTFTTVYRVDPRLKQVTEYAPAGDFSILDIAVTPNGTLWALGTRALWKRHDETWRRVLDVEGVGLCADAKGAVFVATWDRVLEVDDKGEWTVDRTLMLPPSGDCTMGASSYATVMHEGSDFLLDLSTDKQVALHHGMRNFGGVWGLATVAEQVYGVTSSGQLLEIDPRTGETRVTHTFPDMSFTGAATLSKTSF